MTKKMGFQKIDLLGESIENQRFAVEFLRRNSQFLNERKAIFKSVYLFLSKRKSLAPLPPLPLRIKNQLIKFRRKWPASATFEMGQYCDPGGKTAHVLQAIRRYESKINGQENISDFLGEAVKTIKDPLRFNPKFGPLNQKVPRLILDKKEPHTLILSINLSYSNKQILKEIEEEIKTVKAIAREDAAYIFERPKDYRMCLKVYDLKKSGLSWSKVAKEIFPKDVDLNNAIRKCRAFYDTCEELIANGISSVISWGK